jgi:hypothetical protein
MNRLILSLLLLVACNDACGPAKDADPAGEATVAPEPGDQIVDENGVPGATLTNAAGTTQVAATGTYCWGGVCADMIGPIAPADALPVTPDEEVTFTLTAGAPSNVNLRVLEWQVTGDVLDSGEVVVDSEAPVVASGDLDLSQSIQWQVPSEPGEYALSMFTAYQEGGDISYGWHIRVE